MNYQFLNGKNSQCDVIFDCIHILGKFRYQLDKEPEDDLWWRDNQHAELKNYVGTEVDISTPFTLVGMDNSLRFTYRTGQLLGGSPLKKHTFDLRYYIDVPIGRSLTRLFSPQRKEVFAFPVVLRYHSGYLDELYNYSQKVSYLAIGLHARY